MYITLSVSSRLNVMDRQPFQSDSIYDFDDLLVKRKETVKRGQTYNVDEEGEPVRPLYRPKITEDTVKLPAILVGNNNKPPLGGKPASRRVQAPNAAMMGSRVQKLPDWLKDSRRVADNNAVYAEAYKEADEEKKKEWDLRYERMVRERDMLKADLLKNSMQYKEKIAFAPVHTDDRTRYHCDRASSHVKRSRNGSGVYDKSGIVLPARRAFYDQDDNLGERYRSGHERVTSAMPRRTACQRDVNLDDVFADEPDAKQKAEWDRQYDERLMKKDRERKPKRSQELTSTSAFIPAPPTAMNLDRSSHKEADTGPGVNSRGSWTRAHEPAVEQADVHDNNHLPALPKVRQTTGHAVENRTVPQAPLPPACRPAADQSYSKRRRQLKPQEPDPAAPNQANNPRRYPGTAAPNTSNTPHRYVSPTDFINDFDRKLVEAEKIEKKIAAIVVDSDDDFLDDLDDILASPPPKVAPKHKKQ